MKSQNYLHAIWRHRWLVLVMSAVAAAGVGLIRNNATPTYRTSSLLEVTPAAQLSGGQVTPDATAFLTRAYAARATTSPVLADALHASKIDMTVPDVRSHVHAAVAAQSGNIEISTTSTDADQAAALNAAVVKALIGRVAADQAAEQKAVVAPLDAQVAAAERDLVGAPPNSPASATARSTYNALLDARAARQVRPNDRIDIIDQAAVSTVPASPK